MQEQINNSSMLKVGTILRGTYRIDSYLSSGGFGNTYVATNIEFEERVAIKEFFMKGVTHRDDNQTTVSVSNAENNNSFLEQKEKFKKEARRLRKLKNEYIVSVHDLFEENGTAYYVMDYVDGESLAERLKRTGKPMTESEIREILPQILDALKTVHDASIWHLDLKPANIMLTKEGRVKLIDFGASKQLNTQKGGATTSTAISYTNGYAPREQMEQNYDKFGPWTDFYALGASLYNLLTMKRPPMPSDIDDEGEAAFSFSLGISDIMKEFILILLNPNRNKRPKSVDDIYLLLQNNGISYNKVDNVNKEETILLEQEENDVIQDSEQSSSESTILDLNVCDGSNDEHNNKNEIHEVENIPNKVFPPKNEINKPNIEKVDNNVSLDDIPTNREPNEKVKKGKDFKFLLIFSIILLTICSAFFIFSKNDKGVEENVRSDSIVIVRPYYNRGDSLKMLAISSITLTPEQTRIDFFGLNNGYGWITISKDSYISDKEKRYTLRDAEGIEISPQKTYFTEENEPYSFSLIFPPIPSNVKVLDFVESVESDWKFFNINIDPEQYRERNETVQKIISNMVEVKGGSFIMGDDGWKCSSPKSEVELSDYYIGRYEVTQKEWDVIYGNNPSHFLGENRPVECVSWNYCLGFAYVLSELSGRNFRLPTEAEWEYAARGGIYSNNYKYSGSNKLDDVAWYSNNSLGETHSVGLKKPNELGLYDMSGNVWEWCMDYLGDYTSTTKKDPTGLKEGKMRVRRGGSCCEKEKINNAGYSDFWVFSRDGSEQKDNYINVGLRLVMEK